MLISASSLMGFLSSAVEVLIAFYENRLKDHHVITPHVLLGLKALVSEGPPCQYVCTVGIIKHCAEIYILCLVTLV